MNYNYGSDCLEGKTLLYSYYLGSERRRNRMQKYGEIKDLVNAVLESYDKMCIRDSIKTIPKIGYRLEEYCERK